MRREVEDNYSDTVTVHNEGATGNVYLDIRCRRRNDIVSADASLTKQMARELAAALLEAAGDGSAHLNVKASKYEELRAAVAAVHYAAHWSPDRPVDADALWSKVRDVAGFALWMSPKPAVEDDAVTLAQRLVKLLEAEGR